MKYPKIILFDYGDTLLSEPNRDNRRGTDELMKYASSNPHGRTADDLWRATRIFFDDALLAARTLDFDIGAQTLYRATCDYLGLQFSLTPSEVERTFWNAATPGAVVPGAAEMLDALNAIKMRAAVLSNTCWSGETLLDRITRLLPNHQFEFVMASSDYLYRKPHKMIFEIALRKAGVAAEDAWYCGDRYDWDVCGALGAGIFPVWRNPDEKPGLRIDPKTGAETLCIREWSELLEALERLRARRGTEIA